MPIEHFEKNDSEWWKTLWKQILRSHSRGSPAKDFNVPLQPAEDMQRLEEKLLMLSTQYLKLLDSKVDCRPQ